MKLSNNPSEQQYFNSYVNRVSKSLEIADWDAITNLSKALEKRWLEGKKVFICGNGGSAGNAVHLANDFLYGIAKRTGGGLNINALSSNISVITCLANDVGFDSIYSEQLAVMGNHDDLLIVLSGSGNSMNVVNALKKARKMKMESCAIVGFNGGKCKQLCDIPIHFPVNDMQIAEDMQMMVGHMIMQFLSDKSLNVK